MKKRPSRAEPTQLVCPVCASRLVPIEVAQCAKALDAIKAGRELLRACDQAQLFWKHEEVSETFEALSTGQIFETAELDCLSAISERIYYFLTDAIPAYEPVLRSGSTVDSPLVDQTQEQARRLWECIKTFQTLRQEAFDYSTALAFCRRQAGALSN